MPSRPAKPAAKRGNAGAFKAGADPRRARGGGKKGRSGRKPVAFYLGCETATEGVVLPKVLEYLERDGADPSDPAWQWCAAYVSKFSRSEAPKRTEVTGKDGGPMEFADVEETRERVARRLARIAAATGA